MIIKPTAQGIFYPCGQKDLTELFNKFETAEVNEFSKLIIVPHAGYEYSGELAFKAYGNLDKDVKNIIIIAPAIYNRIYGSVSCNAESFETPFGQVKIKPAELEINNSVFECESALTVQLPIIKYLFPNATVTPVIYGCEDYKYTAEFINKNIKDSSIVIATNLSRFVPEREAIKLDGQTARMIERKQIQDLDNELADGAVGICAAIEFAKTQNLNFVQKGLSNSAKTNDDTSSVVGYGAWSLV